MLRRIINREWRTVAADWRAWVVIIMFIVILLLWVSTVDVIISRQ